jgi:hypothetical protein
MKMGWRQGRSIKDSNAESLSGILLTTNRISCGPIRVKFYPVHIKLHFLLMLVCNILYYPDTSYTTPYAYRIRVRYRFTPDMVQVRIGYVTDYFIQFDLRIRSRIRPDTRGYSKWILECFSNTLHTVPAVATCGAAQDSPQQIPLNRTEILWTENRSVV